MSIHRLMILPAGTGGVVYSGVNRRSSLARKARLFSGCRRSPLRQPWISIHRFAQFRVSACASRLPRSRRLSCDPSSLKIAAPACKGGRRQVARIAD